MGVDKKKKSKKPKSSFEVKLNIPKVKSFIEKMHATNSV